jgi:hypothetical protein
MIRAYEEIVEFIAGGTTPESVAQFEASTETKEYVSELIRKEKELGLTPEEASELDQYMQLEHLMRMAKARARSLCSHD